MEPVIMALAVAAALGMILVLIVGTSYVVWRIVQVFSRSRPVSHGFEVIVRPPNRNS